MTTEVDFKLKLNDESSIPECDRGTVNKWLSDCTVKLKEIVSQEDLHRMRIEMLTFGTCTASIDDHGNIDTGHLGSRKWLSAEILKSVTKYGTRKETI